MTETSMTFDVLDSLARGSGRVDVACPMCGPHARSNINKRRKVLRIWNDGQFASYTCARCGTHGWAKPDAGVAVAPRPRVELPPAEDKSDLAAMLWRRSVPSIGSPVETYLRSRSIWSPDLCERLRYLPARSEHPPAMIARFGSNPVVKSVHLTRLKPDGTGKAGTESDKIMIGPSSGLAIVISDNPDRMEIAISEGIEDALSIAIATGWTCWAAGSSSRIPSVVAQATHYGRVYQAVDQDKPTKVHPRGDGAYQLERSRSIRPDIVPLHFAKAFGWRERFDANRTLVTFGPSAILACIDLAEMQIAFRRGQCGFEPLQRAVDQLQAVLGPACNADVFGPGVAA